MDSRTLATMKTNSSIIRSRDTTGSMESGFTVKQRQLQLQLQRRSVMVEVTQTASKVDQSSLENEKETASTATATSSPSTTDTAAAITVTTTARGEEGAAMLLPLKITESCWRRVRFLTEKKGDSLEDTYLRVYVDAGGCSGFSYKFEFDTNENLNDDEDIIYSEPPSDNVNDTDAAALNNANIANNNNGGGGGGVPRVVVDESSLELIQGSTIDYVQEMIKSAFEVRDNPQSESACGCGSSFAVKNFASNPAID